MRRFVDAGFVLLGKTTTSEFGSLPFTESDALGISRNPWDPDRTPGGSSSGAGAAVAAGMAPIAHAEDGGGSIRIPASCNGLVGLKPTRGLVTNAVVEVEGLGTGGVLTRSVADTAAVLDVLARHDPAAWWSPPTPRASFAAAMQTDLPTGLRIGVLTDSPIDGIRVHPACVEAVDVTLRTLESAGQHIVDTLFRCRRPTSWSPRSRPCGTSAVPGSRSRTRTASSRTTAPCARRHERSTRGRTRKGCARPSSCRGASSKASSCGFDLLVTCGDGLPSTARRCLADGHRGRSSEGTAEQLPDGGVHVGVQRDRPAA